MWRLSPRAQVPQSQVWNSLVLNPRRWIDYRCQKEQKKVHAKHPDFKSMDHKRSLWLKTKPDWVKADSLSDKLFLQPKDIAVLKKTDDGQLWQDLCANPAEWVDYRSDKQVGKVNRNHPDFKSANMTLSLWLGNKQQPSWVTQKLADVTSDEFMSAQDVPKGQAQKALRFGRKTVELESWKHLMEHPHMWIDFRALKRAGMCRNKCPDFELQPSGKSVLWLSSSARPDEVIDWLVNHDEGGEPQLASGEVWLAEMRSKVSETWGRLAREPTEWCDYRTAKMLGDVHPEHPDFKQCAQDSNDLALWLDGNEPSWVHGWLLELEKSADTLLFLSPQDHVELKEDKRVTDTVLRTEMWQEFLDNPEKWEDFRQRKFIGQTKAFHPDFKMRGTSKALWLNTAPDWVLDALKGLE